MAGASNPSLHIYSPRTIGDVAGSMVCLCRDPRVSEIMCGGAGGEFLLSKLPLLLHALILSQFSSKKSHILPPHSRVSLPLAAISFPRQDIRSSWSCVRKNRDVLPQPRFDIPHKSPSKFAEKARAGAWYIYPGVVSWCTKRREEGIITDLYGW
jgi:hypothetical protein